MCQRISKHIPPVFRNNLLSDGYIAAAPVLHYHVRTFSPRGRGQGEGEGEQGLG